MNILIHYIYVIYIIFKYIILKDKEKKDSRVIKFCQVSLITIQYTNLLLNYKYLTREIGNNY